MLIENEKINYPLDKVIEINESFDVCFANQSKEELRNLIKTVRNIDLIDAAFKKYFNKLPSNQESPSWVVDVMLSSISFDCVLSSLKDVGLNDNYSVSRRVELVNSLLLYVDEDLWRKLCCSCKPYQVFWFAQNIERDVSFYWDGCDNNQIKEITSFFFMNPFSKEQVDNSNFLHNVCVIFDKLEKEEKIETLKSQIFKMSSLLESQSNVSLPVLIDMFSALYSYGGVESLQSFDEFIVWINSLIDSHQFLDIRDFALNYSTLDKSNILRYDEFLTTISNRLSIYFLFDLFSDSHTPDNCDVDGFEEDFKI